MDIKKKEKVEKTIKKFKENRARPENKLLRKITEKLEWAEKEKQKAFTLINGHKESMKFIQLQIIKLEGAITTLKDLLEVREEIKNE